MDFVIKTNNAFMIQSRMKGNMGKGKWYSGSYHVMV